MTPNIASAGVLDRRIFGHHEGTPPPTVLTIASASLS